MYSAAVIAPGEVTIVDVKKPVLGDYDVLVKTEISFICNATDGKIIDYHMPGLGKENYPLLLGHESVGRIVVSGSKVRNFPLGSRAIGGLVLEPDPVDGYGSGWGGHSEFTVIRDINAMIEDGVAEKDYNETYKIMKCVPDDIPIEAAGLLCTWREVYSGFFDDFKLTPDKRIIIFGAGPVGLSFTRFAKLKGFRQIVTVDPLENKRAMAQKLGADMVFASDDISGIQNYVTNYGKVDAVIDAVGNESIINTALELIKGGGDICVFGVVGKQEIVLQKERGPYNFNLLVHQWPSRDAEAAAQEPLIQWIREGKLDYSPFVTSVFSVSDIAQAVKEVKKPGNIKTMLRFDR